MPLIRLICMCLLPSLLIACAADPFARPKTPVPTPAALVDASEPDPISDMAWRYGEARWARDQLGDPIIHASLGQAPYTIEFFGCDQGRDCKDLRFVAHANLGEQISKQKLVWQVSDWNRERRFGKAVMTEDGGLCLEMNVTLQGGVTRQNLDMTFDWWRVALSEFHTFASEI
ncbi:MAG: YbjN domain-containing protein [Pseudomonadota bacterium]